MFLFGKQKTPQEILKEHQRSLTRAGREMERERRGLETTEKKLIMDIKKMAKQGQMGSVKIMAKDLVRTRSYIQKFHKMEASFRAISLRLATLKSTQAMAQAMQGATKAMMMMNQRMNLPQLQRIMMEFEKQNEKMEMKEEMMDDTLDDVFEADNEEEETEEIVNKVLDEIGINLSASLVDAPSTATKTAAPAKEQDDLQARLDNLKKG